MIVHDRLVRIFDSRIRVLICVAPLVGCQNSSSDGAGTGGAGGTPSTTPVTQAAGTGGAATSHDNGLDAGSDSGGSLALAKWESACIGWLRASCAKAVACGIPPDEDCGKSDVQLRDVCRNDINKDGCSNPDPASFDECRQLDETDSCDMFCAPPQQFCFDFCFFSCLPPAIDPPDGGGIATPDAVDGPTGQPTDALIEAAPAETSSD